jgi:sialate O-acetylesterase
VQTDDPIPWLTSSYDSLTPFSAVCYYFGKALYKRMAEEGDAVPIGLIKNEWGGSLIESWVPDSNPSTGKTYCTERESREGRTPGKLYNSMIMPMSNLTIKGVLWYQVCLLVAACLGGCGTAL